MTDILLVIFSNVISKLSTTVFINKNLATVRQSYLIQIQGNIMLHLSPPVGSTKRSRSRLGFSRNVVTQGGCVLFSLDWHPVYEMTSEEVARHCSINEMKIWWVRTTTTTQWFQSILNIGPILTGMQTTNKYVAFHIECQISTEGGKNPKQKGLCWRIKVVSIILPLRKLFKTSVRDTNETNAAF